MANRQLIVLCLIATTTLGVIVYGLSRKPTNSPGTLHAPVDRPRDKLTPNTLGSVAGEMGKLAESQWVNSGISAPLARELRSDFQRFLPVAAGADFTGYERFMTQLGATLNQGRANKILRIYMAKKYANASGIRWDTAPVAELARLAWEKPELREATWTTLGAESARAGVGWILDPSETAKNAAISFTMFDLPEWTDLIQQAQRGEAPVAWIQFPVGFEHKGASELRYTFVFHSGSQKWMPLRLDVLGPHPKPFLLF
jgi:hypothetical protein